MCKVNSTKWYYNGSDQVAVKEREELMFQTLFGDTFINSTQENFIKYKKVLIKNQLKQM